MNPRAGFPTRLQTVRFCCLRLLDATSHKHVLLLDVHADQKSRLPHARASCLERFQRQARIHAKPPRNCATAKRPLATDPDNPVYSPQRSISSATVQSYFQRQRPLRASYGLPCGFSQSCNTRNLGQPQLQNFQAFC